MTKKEIAEALGINKRDFFKYLLIVILVLALIFSVLLVIKHRFDRYLTVDEPIFLETKIVAYVENGTAYIPLTFLDNLESARYVKEIKINVNGKKYKGEYDEASYDLSSVPRNYGGGRRFYKSELYQKPYAIRKQTITVDNIDLNQKGTSITILYAGLKEKEYPLDISFTNNLERREIVIDNEFIEKSEVLEGVQILMTYSEWQKSEAGEYKLNKKGISNYLAYIYE